jgi:transposase-like protein
MAKMSRVSAGICALARKRRWSERDARRIVEAGARSGLAWSRFAAEVGVDVARLYRWRQRIDGAAPTSAATAPEFISLVPVGASSVAGAAIEVTLENGRCLRVGAAAPVELALAVLGALMC